MRGIQRKYPVNLLRIGIIPAHAGNTHLQTNQPIFHKDHPRSCGEYFAGTYLETSEPGSSPLMRGIQNDLFRLNESDRIIPAHAGNTMQVLK